MRPHWLLLALVLSACQKSASPEASAPSPTQAAPASQPTPSSQPAPQAAAPSGPAQAGGLSWTNVAPLVRRAPKSQMRAAEYGVEGDPKAELSVFYFGPDQGGGVEPNVTRWLGQFTQPDGSDTAQKAKRSERTVNGVKVSLVEATGTYSGGMAMPGAPAPGTQPDAMLLGAIANGPQGSVFFKMVGSREAIERARPAFNALIESLHPAQ